jgi:cytochrome c oxidase subunit 3
VPGADNGVTIREKIMSANPAIHISDPLPLGSSGRVPGNKGIWVGICCEFVEFLVLFAVYFVARAHFPDAFEQGAQRLSLLSGTLITLLMLSSSYCIACAVATIRQQRRRASIRWLLAGLLLALAYPLTKLIEIQWNLAHGIDGQAGIFFSVYYYLTFNHMVHAFWGILGILWALARHLGGAYSAQDHDGLEALASYWHATDIIWLVIFTFFYVLV